MISPKTGKAVKTKTKKRYVLWKNHVCTGDKLILRNKAGLQDMSFTERLKQSILFLFKKQDIQIPHSTYINLPSELSYGDVPFYKLILLRCGK